MLGAPSPPPNIDTFDISQESPVNLISGFFNNLTEMLRGLDRAPLCCLWRDILQSFIRYMPGLSQVKPILFYAKNIY